MRRIIALILVSAALFSLSAAMTENGKDAYEIGRSIVAALSWSEAEERGRSVSSAVITTVEGLRPSWDEPWYEEDLSALGYESQRSLRDLETVRYDGFIAISMENPAPLLLWSEFIASRYAILYEGNAEIREYTLDGKVRMFISPGSDGTVMINIGTDDLIAGGRRIGDRNLYITIGMETMDISAMLDGEQLPSEDIAEFSAVVNAAMSMMM